MPRPALFLAVTLLAAPALAQNNAAAAMDYSNRMSSLTEIQRYAAIRRALQDNGQWCPRVTAAAYQQPVKNLVMWVARCGAINKPQPTLAGTMPKSSADYALFIGPDGTVQAAPCGDLAKMKWPACRPLPAKK